MLQLSAGAGIIFMQQQSHFAFKSQHPNKDQPAVAFFLFLNSKNDE